MKRTKPKKKSVQRWEYLFTVKDCLEDLDDIGKQGWELVQIIPKSDKYHFEEYYFKRRLK